MEHKIPLYYSDKNVNVISQVTTCLDYQSTRYFCSTVKIQRCIMNKGHVSIHETYPPRLCHIHSYFCPNEVLEPLCPNKISQTVLFSKPILLAGDKIAQIWAENQFSPDFGHTNPSATRCYLAGKPKDPRPALIGSGVPEERRRPPTCTHHRMARSEALVLLTSI
jgi:hypothetical protein